MVRNVDDLYGPSVALGCQPAKTRGPRAYNCKDKNSAGDMIDPREDSSPAPPAENSAWQTS